MKVRMPRYELAPLTIAKMENSMPQPMKSPPEADSIRHLRPIESATPSEGFEHR